MFKTIHIIYYNYLNADLRTISIGGIQTYITCLSDVFIKHGLIVHIIQSSDKDFEVVKNGITITGICACKKKFPKLAIQKVPIDDLVIFGTHELIVNFKGYSIAIQHGITWDVPVHKELSLSLNNVYSLQRARMAYRLLKLISKVNLLVCVDNNFINWYRTQVAYASIKMVYIPNFSEVPLFAKKSEESINIIFARRLFWYRGTKTFSMAIKELLEVYKVGINIVIAGTGDDEGWMKEQFCNDSRVKFIKYESSESLSVHSNMHIAVVPTVGSEGTSLSLLEAMAAGCAVVASNVGGMTNIVIDGYNGVFIDPYDYKTLLTTLIKLIDNKQERERLSRNAYLTVKDGFNFRRWAEKWEKIVCNEACE